MAALLVTTGLMLLPCILWAQEPPRVVLESGETPCSPLTLEQLVKELRLRTSIPLQEQGDTAVAMDSWVMSVEASEAESCTINLRGARLERGLSFVLEGDAERVEIASLATRLAWIIEEPELAAAQFSPQTPDGVVEDDISEDFDVEMEGEVAPLALTIDQRRSSRPTSEHGTDPTERFSVDAIGGAMWIPAARTSVAMTGGAASWHPHHRVGVTFSGRLPLGDAQSDAGGYRFVYKPRAMEATVSLHQSLSSRWTLAVGGGGRWTHYRVTAERLDEPDGGGGSMESAANNAGSGATTNTAGGTSTNPGTGSTPEGQSGSATDSGTATDPAVDPNTEPRATRVDQRGSDLYNGLSPLSAVVTAGAGFRLNRFMGLRLDFAAARSLAPRTIHDQERIIMDLGRWELDLLLGLEFRL